MIVVTDKTETVDPYEHAYKSLEEFTEFLSLLNGHRPDKGEGYEGQILVTLFVLDGRVAYIDYNKDWSWVARLGIDRPYADILKLLVNRMGGYEDDYLQINL